ncbi:ParA family protein [uncultured Clostridium sp.]|uniref:ParA family protein n=1 Tax=uncultured Clostridium sp. TaxID=59620 RepID=UPI0025DD9442|nr:ParA family protein [uncultured Clostridium sp.]
MTRVISVINLKGGVGKTTTTVGLAQILSVEFNKKILVVDLDAQTNATTMLIGEEKWMEVNKQKQTIAQLFYEGVYPRSEKIFDINRAILKGVSNIDEVKLVDMLPSSLDLIDIQEEVIKAPRGIFSVIRPVDLLDKSLRKIKQKYDYILIDCPPNLGVITRNGLKVSDVYIIPTVPDVLSTYGIPQIISRVNKFSKELEKEIKPLGIVITKYREQSALHKRTVNELIKERDCRVFETIFKENDNIANAAEYINKSTMRQKWGYKGQVDNFKLLAEEIMRAMGDEYGKEIKGFI